MLSCRLWKSEKAWTPIRIHVSDEKAGKLVRLIGDARMRSDGTTIIEAPMVSVCLISLAGRSGTIAILPIGYLSKAVLSV